MANVKVKMLRHGAIQVMNSPQMQQRVLDRAQKMADWCNEQSGLSGDDCYIADVQPGVTRAHAMVKTTGWKSRRDNAIHNRIIKSLAAV